MLFFFRSLIFIFLTAFLSLGSEEPQLLHTSDVNKIMKQIFEQHVNKKEISDSILKKSFNVYIDQFDPHRIYLEQQEIRPFLQINDDQISRLMQQYQNHQFTDYQNLNGVIQAAIFKARDIRSYLMNQNRDQLFQKSSALSSGGYEGWRDPDLNREFAGSNAELRQHIEQYLIQSISDERRRYGDARILKHPEETLQIIEKNLREHENQYLYVLENGKPMSDQEKENAFSMHVLKALANSLDAHTTVLSSTEAYDMRIRLEKQLDGVGILFQPDKYGEFIISRIVEGGPAFKSNLIKLGDKILEVDRQQVKNMPIGEVMELMRGKDGTTIELTLMRTDDESPGGKIIPIKLTREVTQFNDDRVKYSYENFGDGIIGKIKLDTFYQSDNGITSENDVRDAIKKLDQRGNLQALILDFRENSGGFLSQAVKVAGLFITNGVVVISKYYNGDERFYRDMDGKTAYTGPLIILTSKATASAAEIVAQALQDYGVAIIAGDAHTYGKGTIQSQTVTDNQGSTYFKVTVGKYYTVSGKTPQIQGVKADIVVPSQFVHENIGEEYLEYPLQQDVIASSFDDNLEDVPSNLKSWYMHYYVPSIQHKTQQWRDMFPALKKNSEARILHNPAFQAFLKGNEAYLSYLQSVRLKQTDLQMAEAVNIAKDVIKLDLRQRHGDALEQTAATSGKIPP